MDKVKITRKQAELLDGLLSTTDAGWLFSQLASWHNVTKCTQNMSDLHRFYIEDPLLASTAMIVGYEVEETPEDKVMEYFQKAKSNGESADYDLRYPGQERTEAILFILDALNIKIVGVNHE